MHPKIAHIISHTHWDREWYMPYERHHVRLVKLMDTLLRVLDSDPEFQSFHLDGQTIILEDYLQIRPEMKGKLIQYVQEGRLHIGPWYILQDEFLTSGEANIRNLLMGHKEAESYGSVSKIGYFPDSFGNIGQAPQLFKQAGIDTAVFGRGVKPTGFNNSVADAASYESPFSEMMWESPDGSRVLGILFANWYHNGMEIPVGEEEAKTYWKQKLAEVERFASTPHFLLMNGCDHQPVQTDLSEAIQTARRLFPDIEFVHSNFMDYANLIRGSVPADITVVRGELRSQRTDGWTTLVNTASSRVYIKQANQRCQTLLEKVAEPLATFAHLHGAPYPHHLFTYAWKTLMQNHPHDSICGCSVDEVHREMMTRFDKSRFVAEEIIADSVEWISPRVDTSCFKEFTGAKPFIVYNTSGWERTSVACVELEIARLPLYAPSPSEISDQLAEIPVEGWMIDPEGNKVTCKIEDLGVTFGYDLPQDRFRQPYFHRSLRLTFQAESIPALGYRAYAWIPGEERAATVAADPEGHQTMVTGTASMANEWLAVSICPDGTLHVLDKETNRNYSGLCAYEDVGDIGSEYMFKQPDGELPRSTNGVPAKVRLVENTPFHTEFEIIHEWEVPSGAGERLEQEQNKLVYYAERKAQRVQETVPLLITTRVSLEHGLKAIKVKTSFDNRAKDHRLRVLFPTDIHTTNHQVESIFEIAERDNEPSFEWTNPSNCQHQQAFVTVCDGNVGVTIANKGLNEYEILRDGRNTIAITLLRSVGELGDWGVFPTPEAQCLTQHQLEYEIIPHKGDGKQSGAYSEAYQFQVPWTITSTGIHPGTLPAEHSFLGWTGDSMAFSAVKIAEGTGDLIVRWFNMAREPSTLTLDKQRVSVEWYKSTILEQRTGQRIPQGDGKHPISVQPAEIITLAGKIIPHN
jgi:alpha-mannosidase